MKLLICWMTKYYLMLFLWLENCKRVDYTKLGFEDFRRIKN